MGKQTEFPFGFNDPALNQMNQVADDVPQILEDEKVEGTTDLVEVFSPADREQMFLRDLWGV